MHHIPWLMLVKICCCGSPDQQRGENNKLKMMRCKSLSGDQL
jgi:hypothetical protein